MELTTRFLVECIIHPRNSFSQKIIIRKRLGPNMILLGNPNTDFNMKRIFFGSYDMVYTGTTKKPKIRNIPSIALRESNEYGGHFFMLLHTGKEIHSDLWVELSIYDEVVKRV